MNEWIRHSNQEPMCLSQTDQSWSAIFCRQGLDLLETQIMANSALVSSFVSIDFKVFQRTPHSSLLCNKEAIVYSNKNRTWSGSRASTPPSHSVLGVASEFSRAGWTVQRGSGHQLPQGRRTAASSKIHGPRCPPVARNRAAWYLWYTHEVGHNGLGLGRSFTMWSPGR